MKFPVTMRLSNEWVYKYYRRYGNILKHKDMTIDGRVWYICTELEDGVILAPMEDVELSGLLGTATENSSLH